MNLVGEQVLLYGEETDVSKTFHLHLYLADPLAAISIRKFTIHDQEHVQHFRNGIRRERFF